MNPLLTCAYILFSTQQIGEDEPIVDLRIYFNLTQKIGEDEPILTCAYILI